jgi:hypothetical protein
MFSKKPYIPIEIVDLIADYHDYDKYCKPEHSQKLVTVLETIKTMSEIMDPIMPNIAYICWGNGLSKGYDLLWRNDVDINEEG